MSSAVVGLDEKWKQTDIVIFKETLGTHALPAFLCLTLPDVVQRARI